MPKKLTHDEFVEEIKLINPRLKIIGRYVNNKTKIECQCLDCCEKLFIQPSYIKSSKGGHVCKDKIRTGNNSKSHEKFVKELHDINADIQVVGEYIKAQEKIECVCKICNHTWYPFAYSLLQGQGCPKCGVVKRTEKRKKSYDDFIKELNEINKNIIVIGKYVDYNTKIKCECKVCGNIWLPTPKALLRGSGCPICAIQKNADNLRKTHEEYVNELIENNISLRPIEQYIDSRTSILHKCLHCSSEHKYAPNDVLRRKYCTICQGNDLVVKYGVNSLWDTNPEIAEMLVNKEDGEIYSYKSTKKCNFICPNCRSLVKNKQIQYVVKHGLPCQKCSDGISYPMKFICCMFNQLNIEYDTEVTFNEWSFMLDDYIYKPRYDIVFRNYIVEVDGGFHKKEYSKKGRTIEEIKYIDNQKDILALNNGYKMIRIDCCESDMEYIKNNVLSSELNNMFDLSKINWIECHKYAISSKVKEVCDYWNQLENPSVTQVFTDLKMPRITVQRWLKKGALAGMCDYDPKREHLKNSKSTKNKKRKSVICLSTNKVYESISNAEKETGISASSISCNCIGKTKFAGRDKITGIKFQWLYYEDYLKNITS